MTRPSQTGGLRALAVAVSLLAAACGSTAAQHGQDGPTGADALGGSSPAGPAGSAQAGQSAAVAGTLPSSGSAASATNASATLRAQGPSSIAPGSAAAAGSTSGTAGSGPRSPVLVGYITSHDAEQVYASLGLSGVALGDISAETQIAARDVNSRGGLAGHTIQLLDHDGSTANSATNPDAEQEKACNDFTQDHHVNAVADTLGATDTILHDCLVKRGIPLFIDFGGGYDYRQVDYQGPVFGPSLMTIENYTPALVRGLKQAGWFGGWDTVNGKASAVTPVKLGIMHFDDPKTDTYVRLWKQTAAALGYQVVDDVAYPQELDQEAASTQNAVLKFRSDGVTHVINANILFYKDAQSQNYHPRYEVDDTLNTPQLLTQNADASQLHGSMGVGYRPLDEVNNPPDMSSATTRCRRIMAAGGQRPPGQLAQGLMLGICDEFWLLEALANKGGGLSPAQLDSGANALGSLFQPALTYRATITAQVHAPADTVRPFSYQDACGCFVYVGPPHHI